MAMHGVRRSRVRLAAILLIGAGVLAGCRGQERPAAAATESDSAMRSEIAAFERAWANAATARDRAQLERLMAPEWTITLADGRRSTRPRAVAHWTAPPSGGVLRDTSIVDSVEVRPLGRDAAVALVAITDVGFYAARAETTRTHVTDVVVRREGRWQALVSHESILPPPPRPHP